LVHQDQRKLLSGHGRFALKQQIHERINVIFAQGK
jgi:hypothetical protein